MSVQVKVVNKSLNPLPSYQTALSAGFDLHSNEEDFILYPGQRKLVGTGIFIELPAGYEMQIRPRSGMAFKHGVTVLNSPGTIDADYRGEIKVLLYNSNISLVPSQDLNYNESSPVKWNNAGTDGLGPAFIKKGERIAQGVLAKHEVVVWVDAEILSDTDRGEGGFGSTNEKK